MNLSLAQIAQVLEAPLGAPDMLAGFSACVDVLFDWFDRKAVLATGYPEVVLAADAEEIAAPISGRNRRPRNDRDRMTPVNH